MRYPKLERLYENMLVPVGPMSVSVEPGPRDIMSSTCNSCDEEMSEEEEYDLAVKIMRLTDSLDTLASEAHVKAFRRRIEDLSELIRGHAKKLATSHQLYSA